MVSWGSGLGDTHAPVNKFNKLTNLDLGGVLTLFYC